MNVPTVGTELVLDEMVGEYREGGVTQPTLTPVITEYISRLQAMGYSVNDDNDHAPENIQTTKIPKSSSEKAENIWSNLQSTCNQMAEGHRHEDPKTTKPLEVDWCIDYFMYFLQVVIF